VEGIRDIVRAMRLHHCKPAGDTTRSVTAGDTSAFACRAFRSEKGEGRRRGGAWLASSGKIAENDGLFVGERSERSERNGNTAESKPRAIDSWNGIGTCGGIYFETGTVPLKLENLPQGVRLAVVAAQNKQAGGITVLDLNEQASFTQYFVICTGFSTPQIQAICNEVEEVLYKEMKRSPEHREGHRSAEWALLDFGGFIVHVFGEQAREYYDLERLWRAAPKLEFTDETESRGKELSEKVS
jgi:ribosome-associated protein